MEDNNQYFMCSLRLMGETHTLAILVACEFVSFFLLQTNFWVDISNISLV